MNKIFTIVAFFAVTATPVFGKPLHGSDNSMSEQNAAGSYAQAPGAMKPNPYAVIEGGRVIGQDPDLDIREELLREDGFENR